MSDTIPLKEKYLYEIWKKKEFKVPLKTVSGVEIEVLEPGVHNTDNAGADFLNAKIIIGNLTFVGDVEIDKNYEDWKIHGHNIDSKYGSVILHAGFFNKNKQNYVYTKEGRKIPTVCLSDFVSTDLIEKIGENDQVTDEGEKRTLKCAYSNDVVDVDVKISLIKNLGIERFNKKCEKVFRRLKELKYISELKIKEPVINYDITPEFEKRQYTRKELDNKFLWEQLFYELLFEALGFTKNKQIMNYLAQNVTLEFFRKFSASEDFILLVESVLFNVSGLFSETDIKDEYTQKLKDNWENLSRIYDGRYIEKNKWQYLRQRPMNFPTIRIAAGSRFVNEIINNNYIWELEKKIKEIQKFQILSNILKSLLVVKSEGYWKDHFVFCENTSTELKYFVGISRAEDIIVNVVLPYFMVYFDVYGETDYSKKIINLYTNFHQTSDNKIVVNVSEDLNLKELSKKTVYQQGMIELFRNLCSKNKCLECEIGKKVFN